MRQARWNLLGHVLRLLPQSPPQVALDLYIMPPKVSKMKGRIGRHQTGLMTVIKEELQMAAAQNFTYQDLKLTNQKDLGMLRRLYSHQQRNMEGLTHYIYGLYQLL